MKYKVLNSKTQLEEEASLALNSDGTSTLIFHSSEDIELNDEEVTEELVRAYLDEMEREDA